MKESCAMNLWTNTIARATWAFAALHLISCTTEKTELNKLVEQHQIITDLIIVLNPNTRCSGCYDAGFMLGQYFSEISSVVTTEQIAKHYTAADIVVVDKETILKLVPKPYLSYIISVSGQFEPIVLDPSQIGTIMKRLETLP